MPNNDEPPKNLPMLALKLREAMLDKGVSQAEVARVFGVKASTVSSDWRVHGRIGKEHYPKLVGYFGKPYEWWFGEPIGGAAPDLYALRRENLRLAIDLTWGGSIAAAAAALGMSVDDVHRHLDPRTRRYAIAPALARKIERIAKLGSGWLDVPHYEPPSEARKMG